MIHSILDPRFVNYLLSVNAPRCIDSSSSTCLWPAAATGASGSRRRQRQPQAEPRYVTKAWAAFLEGSPDIRTELQEHKSAIFGKLRSTKLPHRYSWHPSDDVQKLICELREKKELRNFVYKERAFAADIWLQVYKKREQDKVVRKFRYSKSGLMLQDTYKRPDLVLKRICYRIRWIAELACRAFDLDMFYSTRTARILLGLLGSKMSFRNECILKHIAGKLSRADRSILRRAIHRLAMHSQSMPAYIKYLLMKTSKNPAAVLAIPRHEVHADGSIPGFHRTTTKEHKHMQSMMEQSLPPQLSSRIVDKGVCWHCNVSEAKTSVCFGCKTARYCTMICQHKAWTEHKLVCTQYCRMFNNPPFKQCLQSADPQMKWLEVIAQCGD